MDERGRPMTPTFAYGKQRRSYRYYVAPELVRGEGSDTAAIRRVPADAVESLVGERLGRLLGSPSSTPWSDLSDHLVQATILPDALHLIIRLDAATLGGHDRDSWIRRVEHRLLSGDRLQPEPGTDDLVRLTAPVRMQVRGGRTWLMRPDGTHATASAKPDPALIKALRRAHEILAKGGAAVAPAVEQLTEVRSARASFERKIARLAFLAPDIQQAILEGRQPPGLTLARLSATQIPPAWADQRKTLGFAELSEQALAG